MSDLLPTLFSPLALCGQTLRNRIFSTGHMTVMLQVGLPTDAMVAHHAARAEEGAAQIYATWPLSCERSLYQGTYGHGHSCPCASD